MSLSLRNSSNIVDDTVRTPDHGFLASAMGPIYKRVSKIKGIPKAPKKRIAEFEKLVCKPSGVWMKVHDGIEEAASKLFRAVFTELHDELNKIFDGIHAKFNLLCEDTVAKTELRSNKRKSLLQS